MPPKPWTGASIKALRDEIVRGGEEVPGLNYQTVYVWYSQVLLGVVDRLGLVNYGGIIGKQPEVSFRVKTVDTLRDKLIRQDSTPLYRIHDIIGARISASMTIQQQDTLVQAIASLFPKHQISDMRDHPHSGYRAVHVIAGLSRGIFVEIQVRTMLQDAWANCYEALADRFGRGIRYGEYPQDTSSKEHVLAMQELSDAARALELRAGEPGVNQIINSMTLMLRSSADYYRMNDRCSLERFREVSGDTMKLVQQVGGEHGRNGNPVQPKDR